MQVDVDEDPVGTIGIIDVEMRRDAAMWMDMEKGRRSRKRRW
jgi:hypothetical protein